MKTFGPRGTVHLMPAADLPAWTGALAAVPMPAQAFHADVRLSPDRVDDVVEAIALALSDADGTADGLTADELDRAVVTSVGACAGELVMPAFAGLWPRWRQAITTAAHRGVLCFGADRGRLATYTHPRRWVSGFVTQDPRTSLEAVLGSDPGTA